MVRDLAASAIQSLAKSCRNRWWESCAMQYGSGLPITALPDVGAVKAYVEALEAAGFDFTSTAGHVMAQPAGTNPQRPDRQYVGPFYDPFVTFSYLAAVTQRL